MKKRFLAATLTAAIVAIAQSSAFAQEDKAAGSRSSKAKANGIYIVEMLDRPVVAYEGGVDGLRATKPTKGKKINPNDPDVQRYAAHLEGKHDAALAAVGGGRKVYSYRYTYNGFAAELSDAAAAKLAATPGVLAVSKDEKQFMDTASSPRFLGLDAANGLWNQLGGTKNAGEGVVIGIVDSGIWPEHPSVSDRTGANGNGTQSDKLDYKQLPGWHGKCTPGETFPASMCSQKLIAAQYYNAGYGGNAGVRAELPYEFLSARDFDGHGTHTATTAGGNFGIDSGTPFGSISGMAPRARIAAYKVCWGTGDEGGCFPSDSVAAIDQAVADGVDVINFSISGSRTNFRDPVEIAFLFAADAGVFVAASAGNSGPTASTVAHPSPWITTVAASTQSRQTIATVTLGNAATYTGSSYFHNGVAAAPLVDSVTVGLPGKVASEVERCFLGTLDPAKVAGKIVLCLRGVNARVDKSAEVAATGGVGMILYNNPDADLIPDVHSVPTVHVNSAAGLAIKSYIATAGAGATATIAPTVLSFDALAPTMASFSSRGPLLAGGGDLLKPDVTAPGFDILAGVSPAGHGGKLFDFLSGTSMSSPHVAGIGALLKHAHPTWSPAAIKSALMTTAFQTTKSGTPGLVFGNVFSFGAGHIEPNKATDPGIVYDSNFANWLGFLCGTQLPVANCTNAGVPVLDPSNLNLASIAVGDLAGTQTLTRTVTNVGSQRETYSGVATLSGFNVVLTPSSFTLNPGQSQTFTIAITRTTATLNAYTQGALVWTGDKGHSARSPMVVRPLSLAAPAQVSSNGAATSYNVIFGYAGAFSATSRGLIPAVVTDGSVADDPTNNFVVNGPGTISYDVTIPAGTTYARFSLFDESVAPAGSDLDLYVTNSAGTLVAASGNGGSTEEANLANPPAGAYKVWVHGWGVPAGTATFKLHSWILGSTSAGNMTVSAPASATVAGSGTIGLTFSGLAPATKYLGSVVHAGAAGMPVTIVRVDTP